MENKTKTHFSGSPVDGAQTLATLFDLSFKKELNLGKK